MRTTIDVHATCSAIRSMRSWRSDEPRSVSATTSNTRNTASTSMSRSVPPAWPSARRRSTRHRWYRAMGRKASRCGYARRTTACQRRKSFARSSRATLRKRRTKRLSSERRGVEVALTVRPPARPEHPIRMPVAPGGVLDNDFNPRDEGRVLCGQRVNRADVPVLVEPYGQWTHQRALRSVRSGR